MADSDKPIIVDGIKVSFCSEDFEDEHYWDLVQDIDQNPGKLIKAMRYIMGDEDYDALKDKLKNKKTGKTSINDIANWFAKASEKVGADIKK